MSNFKAGDLAVTLIDLPPLMAGSIVELVEHIAKGDVVLTPQGPRVANGEGWICAHALVPLNAAYAASALMPLRGDFQPERQKSQEVPA
ncbi:hypothetical protein QM298_14110 [Pseudomonas mendocina]|nr:hypothetical protein [Pseudomonas mendocina]MCW1937539.1 hypothetical protein [Pseudomonas sp. MDMC_285]MDV5862013.1 hypothetical protein [Pseudomonas mendocina]